MIPRKLPPIPKAMLNSDCDITLNASGISEDGEELPSVTYSGRCAFSEKRKRVYDAEKNLIQLEGQVVIPGDIAPTLSEACTGTITVNGTEYTVYAVKRPRNPDGSVHHTSLEIM